VALLSPFSDSWKRAAAGRWVPEESTGALGKLFFAFVSSLVELGHRKALVQEDLWDTAQCVFA